MMRGIFPVLGSDAARLSLLYVDDLAEGVLNALESGKCLRRPYELHDGHPRGYSWNDLIQAGEKLRGKPIVRVKIPATVLNAVAGINVFLARNIGYTPMLTPGKVRELTHPDWVCDNTEFQTATGWQPRFSFEEGLLRVLQPQQMAAASNGKIN
jgi:nucleoside-diphosphate-sugar epimerase